MFTDVFLPHTAQVVAFDRVRAQSRPDGTKLKAQMWIDPHELSAADLADTVYQDIIDKKPGVVELDVEPNSTNRTEADGKYAQYMADLIPLLRVKARWMEHFPFRLNVPPNKAHHLPNAVTTDPYLYASVQAYYGDMSRVSEAEALTELLERGVPLARAAITYGVIAPDKDGVRRLTLPTIFYQGRVVRKLRRGLVFTDDLLADQGLI